MGSCFDMMTDLHRRDGAGFVVLLDPDKLSQDALREQIAEYEDVGVDAFFVGGSLVHSTDACEALNRLKDICSLPLIGFPGSVQQITSALDAVLYLSIVSGRNPDFLFGRHLYVAPVIKRLGIESISTAYMLVESGPLTTAQYLNHSLPLPRTKPELAAATALAAEMMGMKVMYLDGGSGAEQPVPVEMINAVRNTVDAPIIVGGGLRDSDSISARVSAGADIIVVGNALEKGVSNADLRSMVAAAHGA